MASFRNGTNHDEWPKGGFKIDVSSTLNGGIVTVTGTLLNHADFDYGTGGFQATLTASVEGSETSLAIDDDDGSISGSFSADPGQQVMLRFQAYASINTPLDNRLVAQDDCLFEAQDGVTVTFSQTVNTMPAPSWVADIGWVNGPSTFRWEPTFSSADGAALDPLVKLQLHDNSKVSISSVDPSSTSAQACTANFTKAEASSADGFEVWLTLASATGLPRRERTFGIWFRDVDAFGAFPAADRFKQDKSNGVARLTVL